MKNILVLNAGSSSLKFAVHCTRSNDVERKPLARGLFEIGAEGTTLSLSLRNAPPTSQRLRDTKTHAGAIEVLMEILRNDEGLTPHIVGHRVVHGGGVYTEPRVVDEVLYRALEGFVPLAPLHQPHNLAPIAALMTDGIPQVACFDTGFHGTIPRVNSEYALPLHWTEKGYRKFGFHGLSYEYIASVLPSILGERARGKVIVAHLGSGSSLCGMENLKSVVTTLEFSTIGRLTMGTRPGAIDAVMALEMAREVGIDAVVKILHKESGLLGLSGLSGDVRDLESAAAKGNVRAAFALDFFAERVAQEIGMLAAALRGLDVLVFTAGIGERGSAMRERICTRLEFLGVSIDAGLNVLGSTDIGKEGASVRMFVVPTNEELMIARHAAQLIV